MSFLKKLASKMSLRGAAMTAKEPEGKDGSNSVEERHTVADDLTEEQSECTCVPVSVPPP